MDESSRRSGLMMNFPAPSDRKRRISKNILGPLVVEEDIEKWLASMTKINLEEKLNEAENISKQANIEELRKLLFELDATDWMYNY